MAFGVKFTPLTPDTQRRVSLVDVTNASTTQPEQVQVDKAIQYVDTIMNDFFRIYSQNYGDINHSSSPVQGSIPQISNDKMEVDPSDGTEEYDVFPDLAFLESIDPQPLDILPLSVMEDQSSTPESSEYDIGLAQMMELRELLLETFPDEMPKEIDYESILAHQHVALDPLDPLFWICFEGSETKPSEGK